MYRYMLLLKKKKYAAVTVEKKANGKMVNTTELKGRSLLRFFFNCNWNPKLQGHPTQSVPFYTAVMDRNEQVRFSLKVVLRSWDKDIYENIKHSSLT